MTAFLVVTVLTLKLVFFLWLRRPVAAWWLDRQDWKRRERDAQRNIDQGAT